MKAFQFLLILLHLLFMGVVADDISFAHDMALHPDYKMWWSFDEQDITVKIKVKATGWVGWGLSQKGRMKGADMVIGWVDGQGVNHFHDRHASGNYQPTIDQHQDYELLQMSEEGGFTSIIFKRRLQLEDEDDFTITEDTVRILWAWSDIDPVDDYGPLYHGVNRGVRSAFLLDYGDHKRQPLPAQYCTFDVAMKEANIPPQDTVYWCKLIKIPPLGPKKQHIIRVDPIIEPGNEPFVHHMLLFHCNEAPDHHSGKQGNCRIRNMANVKCTDTAIYAWAVGGGPFYFPLNSGMSLNTAGDPKFLLLETHYDNPRKRRDIVDSSGARFYYTEMLRDFDANVVQVGLIPGAKYSQIIPQQQQSFTSYGFCPAKCLHPATTDYNKNLNNYNSNSYNNNNNNNDNNNNNNINNKVRDMRPKIWAVGLHTHVHGTKVVVRLMNDTSGEEVRTIAQDLNYDFNYQEARYLKEPVEIPPNHRIDVECTANTMDLREPLLNGRSTQEEMCLAYLFITPKLSTTTCLSLSTNAFLYGSVHLGWNVNLLTGRIQAPVNYNGETYAVGGNGYEPLLKSAFWEGNDTRVRSYESMGETAAYLFACRINGSMGGGFAVHKPRILLQQKDSLGSGGNNVTPRSFLQMLFCILACKYL